MELVITINHFDIPMYLADKLDGWLIEELLIILFSFVKQFLSIIERKLNIGSILIEKKNSIWMFMSKVIIMNTNKSIFYKKYRY